MNDFVEKEKISYLKRLTDDAILSYIEREQSQEIIYYGLFLLKNPALKISELERLTSVELKVKLLNSIKKYDYIIRGIEGLYKTSDCSKIREGLLPSELTFGIEIEAKGEKNQIFIDNFNYEKWKIVEENTVNKGVEFVSPIMHYTREDLSNISRVCTFMDANDFFVNQSCGGHIHMGFEYLKKVNEFLNLLFLYNYFEKELYLISNNEKFMCRDAAKRYANSFKHIFDTMEIFVKNSKKLDFDAIKRFIEIDSRILNYKDFGLNIYNIINRLNNTIEFRVPNGTLEYDDWHKNIILYGSIMKYAKKISSSKDSQSNFYDFISDNRTPDIRINNFMNMLFEDEDLKNIYYSRYNAHLEDPMVKKLEIKEFNFNKYRTLRTLAEK
ncbi:MAG: hypothetical protein GX032_04760 [Tenericutes bacterium]|nr:hypothetical protein [Mycoplasmatota bacterium]